MALRFFQIPGLFLTELDVWTEVSPKTMNSCTENAKKTYTRKGNAHDLFSLKYYKLRLV
jgi:hypothetical protein